MKFNHIFLSVALSAALMGSFTSCDDFLAEDPYAFVGPDQVGNDNVAVNLWVTGVYSKWANDMFRWQNFPRVLEMDCDYTSGPDWAFSNLGAGNFQGDEVADAVWKGCYSLINRANVALNYVNQITGADEKVKANAIGELKFNKAFAYSCSPRHTAIFRCSMWLSAKVLLMNSPAALLQRYMPKSSACLKKPFL